MGEKSALTAKKNRQLMRKTRVLDSTGPRVPRPGRSSLWGDPAAPILRPLGALRRRERAAASAKPCTGIFSRLEREIGRLRACFASFVGSPGLVAGLTGKWQDACQRVGTGFAYGLMALFLRLQEACRVSPACACKNHASLTAKKEGHANGSWHAPCMESEVAGLTHHSCFSS